MIQKKKKEEGKFLLFRPYSRPISAVSGRFRHVLAVFRLVSAVSAAGRYDPIWPIRLDFGRISLVRRESKPIRQESSRISAIRAESARIQKKKSDMAPTLGQPHRCFLAPKLVLGYPNKYVIFAFKQDIFLKIERNIIY